MVVELLSLAAVLAGGCLLLRTVGLTGWALPVFGLVAGVCLQLTIGLVQVLTPLPTWPALTLALTAGLPALWWLLLRQVRRLRSRPAARFGPGQGGRQGHPVTLSVRYAGLALAGLAVAVAVLRTANLVKWHTDSFRYLMTGSLLADGSYYTAVGTESVTKRLIGVPLLHAPAHLHGEYYLRAITPLLAAATLAIFGWFCWQGLAGRLDRRWLIGFTLLGIALLASGNRFVFSAFYINGHLLVGVLVLVVAGAGWRLSDRPPDRALMLLQALAIPAIVVTRPEGSLLAGLALLPTLLSERVPLRHRAALILLLGAATAGWQGMSAWVHAARGAAVPLSVTGPLVAGVLLAAAGVAVWWWQRLPAWWHRLLAPEPLRLLWLAELGLWLALAALALRRPAILVDSVRATAQNLLLGNGRWGLSLAVLGVLVAAAMVFARFPHQAYLRFPVTAFVPMGFLLAYLRDAAFRVGYGDSLSRMFMHIVPLAVLYVIVAAAHRAVPERAPLRTVSA